MPDLLKLNLGACETRIPGFLNVDIDPRFKPDVLADLRTDDPFEPGSVVEVYCSHMLEHMTLNEAFSLLDRLSRWLVPGGVFLLAVPDFAFAACRYIGGAHDAGTLGMLYGGWEHEWDVHKSHWTRLYLHDTLMRHGFSVVESFEPFVYEDCGQMDWTRSPSIRFRCTRIAQPESYDKE